MSFLQTQNGAAVAPDNPLSISNVAATVVAGQQTITGPGTPIQVGTATLYYGVTIRGMPANAGTVFVGSGTVVSSTNGYPLKNTDSVFVCVDNLSDIWLDTDTLAAKVGYIGS